MKTKLFLALAAAAAITISGCSKSETLQTPEIEVSNLSTTSFSFTWTAIPDATGYTYEVKAANQSTVTSGNSGKPANVEVTGLSMASTYTVFSPGTRNRFIHELRICDSDRDDIGQHYPLC